jgi:hypothetical protein
MLATSDETIQKSINQSQTVFHQIGDTFLSVHSLTVLAIALLIAIILGRFVGYILRRTTNFIARQADKTEDLASVNRLRRIETLIILSIALIRAVLIAGAVYFWWLFVHPNQQPTALIGASAVFAIIIAGVLGPVLRDLTYGSVMMAEHWFAVGDHVKIEPFADVQGVVERVTLRSTRIRGLNGEVTWINNQNIQAVRITPKGIRTIAIEMFVSNVEKGLELVEQVNTRLPSGPLMVISPLTVMVSAEVGHKLWHITAIGETAPGREWLLEKHAIDVINEVDAENEKSILVQEPIARFSDSEAERRFARTIHNARKRPVKKSHRRAAKAKAKTT